MRSNRGQRRNESTRNLWGRLPVVACMLFFGATASAAGPTTAGEKPTASAPDGRRVAVKQDTPRAALESLQQAAEAADVDALAACVEPDYQAAIKTVLGAACQMVDKARSVKKAVADRFGQETAEKVFKGGMMDDMSMSPLKKAEEGGKVNWDKIKINQDGDNATVEINGEVEKDLELKKVEGKWFVVPGDRKPEEMNKQAAQAKKMAEAMTKALIAFEKRVKDGTLAKDKVQDEFAKAMMGALTGGALDANEDD